MTTGIESKFFSSEELENIEHLTMADSGLATKDLQLLSGIMDFLTTKGYMSHLQKANVHRILEKYKCLV